MEDRGETTDLADQYGDILQELIDHWAVYASETGLIELGRIFSK